MRGGFRTCDLSRAKRVQEMPERPAQQGRLLRFVGHLAIWTPRGESPRFRRLRRTAAPRRRMLQKVAPARRHGCPQGTTGRVAGGSSGYSREMGALPPPLPGTALRILATSDLGAATVPMRTSHGLAGTCAGVAALLERERVRVSGDDRPHPRTGHVADRGLRGG